VDVNDLLQMLSSWGACAESATACPDLDGNGVVDVDDLVTLVLAWGTCLS
jgi:hypothetical protein